MKTLDQLIARFMMLFFVIHRTPCGEPECRCKNHEVLGPSRLFKALVIVFMLSMFLYSCWVTHQ
jgi:hypothetical protein